MKFVELGNSVIPGVSYEAEAEVALKNFCINVFSFQGFIELYVRMKSHIFKITVYICFE